MSDLTERLRDEATRLSGRSFDRSCVDSGIAANLADEAADEIERLRAALREIYDKYVVDLHGAGVCDCDPSVGIYTCAPCAARAALAESSAQPE
jgi:hypothetical protein